jgi:hypothetical protein
LFGGNTTQREFYSHHLYTGLALTIYTACQAQAAKLVIVNFPLAE